MSQTTQPVTSKGKVALGMSGGVDSSLAAHLLVEQGYEVTGVFLECWRAPGCRSEEDRKDALKVALELGIPFTVLDFKQAYKDKVVEYFFTEYEAGRTPNPDVMCNKEIKFGLFYDWAMTEGFDYVATGHYAQTDHQHLLSSVDVKKDQTYFLYLLTPDQLNHVLFPIGHLTKPAVRAEARRKHLHVSTKKDSVGICFIGDINVHEFLKDRLGEKPGDVVDTEGQVIGRHQGLWFYTIGQRHGFTVEATTVIQRKDGSLVNKHNLPPFYVVRKDSTKNQLVVGFGSETFADQFDVLPPHWITPPTTLTQINQQLLVRIRHTGALWPCIMTELPSGELRIKLDQPIQGLAEGQSAVFYTPTDQSTSAHPNYVCLGGGVIKN